MLAHFLRSSARRQVICTPSVFATEEAHMYARTVRIQLKPNSVAAFTRTLEHTIITLLRTQPGFQDEIAFVVPGGKEAVRSSVWDQQADAETYAGSTYPQVLKAVANVVEGTPQVDTYEVSNSTFHKIAARLAV